MSEHKPDDCGVYQTLEGLISTFHSWASEPEYPSRPCHGYSQQHTSGSWGEQNLDQTKCTTLKAEEAASVYSVEMQAYAEPYENKYTNTVIALLKKIKINLHLMFAQNDVLTDSLGEWKGMERFVSLWEVLQPVSHFSNWREWWWRFSSFKTTHLRGAEIDLWMRGRNCETWKKMWDSN